MGNTLIEGMKKHEWIKTNDERKREHRLNYLKTFVEALPEYCPECNNILISSQDEDETYCNKCGLITSMSIEYVAGQKINLPHGRH